MDHRADAGADAEIASLIAQITAAFRDVTRGDGVTLHETKARDDYGAEEHRREARAWDTDAHWWDVPAEDLREFGSYASSYLDGPGRRYYLPAYLLLALRAIPAPWGEGPDTLDDTLGMLTHSERRPHLAAWTRDKWAALTDEQGRAVCRFLRYVAARCPEPVYVEDAERALRQHWGRFCPEAPRKSIDG